MTDIKTCDCCWQKIMIYKRSLRKTLIDWLIQLHKNKGMMNWREIWVTDIKILKFWGFIYTDDSRKSNIGITPKWEKFLQGKIRVPKTAFVFNNTLQDPPDGYEENYVSIKDIGIEIITKDSMLQKAFPVIFKS